MAALPIDFTFEYETPNTSSRKGRMRTPMKIILQDAAHNTGGLIFISKEFASTYALPLDEIAMQIKGQVDTYIIFNPPKTAPRFPQRHLTAKKGAATFAATDSVRKMMDIFIPTSQTSLELWLDRVGTFNDSVVYRVRPVRETDSLYKF